MAACPIHVDAQAFAGHMSRDAFQEAGQADQFQTEFSRLRDQWIELGRPAIVPACSTCFQIFQTHLPEVKIVSLWQVLTEKGLPDGLSVKDSPLPLAVHDPCTTRHEPGIQKSVRSLLQQLGRPIEELKLGRNHTECCGFGGGKARGSHSGSDLSGRCRAGPRRPETPGLVPGPGKPDPPEREAAERTVAGRL